jgi:hypothetical protein
LEDSDEKVNRCFDDGAVLGIDDRLGFCPNSDNRDHPGGQSCEAQEAQEISEENRCSGSGRCHYACQLRRLIWRVPGRGFLEALESKDSRAFLFSKAKQFLPPSSQRKTKMI